MTGTRQLSPLALSIPSPRASEPDLFELEKGMLNGHVVTRCNSLSCLEGAETTHNLPQKVGKVLQRSYTTLGLSSPK